MHSLIAAPLATIQSKGGSYLPLIHRHFQDTLLIFNHLLVFGQSFDVRDHRNSTGVHFDSGPGIANVETQVEDILDGLTETPGIDDEFEEVDGGVFAEELADRSDHFIGRILLLLNIALLQLRHHQPLHRKADKGGLGTSCGRTTTAFVNFSACRFATFLTFFSVSDSFMDVGLASSLTM